MKFSKWSSACCFAIFKFAMPDFRYHEKLFSFDSIFTIKYVFDCLTNYFFIFIKACAIKHSIAAFDYRHSDMFSIVHQISTKTKHWTFDSIVKSNRRLHSFNLTIWGFNNSHLLRIFFDSCLLLSNLSFIFFNLYIFLSKEFLFLRSCFVFFHLSSRYTWWIWGDASTFFYFLIKTCHKRRSFITFFLVFAFICLLQFFITGTFITHF